MRSSVQVSVQFENDNPIDFPSIIAAQEYLKSKGLSIHRTTISRYINLNKAYKGYTFKRK